MYQTTEPAVYWQQQLVEWGPKVLFAILILVATHFIAKAVQWGLAKLVDHRENLATAGPAIQRALEVYERHDKSLSTRL